MILITSANFVNLEIASEWGEIPPVFLPVKNSRLIYSQIDLIKKCGEKNISLSLPVSFRNKINKIDIGRLEELGVKIIYVPDYLSLTKSILYSLERINTRNDIKILHGDTLFNELNQYSLSNSISINLNISTNNYKWGGDFHNPGYVYSGFFSFSYQNYKYLVDKLGALDSFESVIRDYDDKFNLKRIKNNIWYDFGHINTYYLSLSKLLELRQVNSCRCYDGILTKYSDDKLKIIAEINWFLSFQNNVCVPKILDYDFRGSYSMEYITLPLLSNIFVYGDMSIYSWERIFLSCKKFLDSLPRMQVYEPQSYDAIYSVKTFNRLGQYIHSPNKCISNFDIHKKIKFSQITIPSLYDIATECINNLSTMKEIGGIHGDFHFGNILYNFKNDIIKVIDPRGLDGQNDISVYGDPRYDIAKLAHSVVGGYDYIISGYNTAEIDENNGIYFINQILPDENITHLFFSIFCKFLKMDIIRITILLFISMVPLHNDNEVRQKTMIATAAQLYTHYLL